MSDSVVLSPADEAAERLATPTRAAVVAATPGVQTGARWFWWIAGLSLVNTVMHQSGSDGNFVVGLGMTIMVDAIFESLKVIGFVVDALMLGFFVLMGLFGQRGQVWAFFVGAAVYLCDAFIYLYADDLMPVAFHGFALFFIVKAGLGLREALKIADVR